MTIRKYVEEPHRERLPAIVLGFNGKVLVVGGYKGGFCEELLEASPMSDRSSASWVQDGPAARQGQAHQRQW